MLEIIHHGYFTSIIDDIHRKMYILRKNKRFRNSHENFNASDLSPIVKIQHIGKH